MKIVKIENQNIIITDDLDNYVTCLQPTARLEVKGDNDIIKVVQSGVVVYEIDQSSVTATRVIPSPEIAYDPNTQSINELLEILSNDFFYNPISKTTINFGATFGGVHETFPIVNTENIDQPLPNGIFYGSRQNFAVGIYSQVEFYLADNTAILLESCQLRFAIYDDAFAKIREASMLINSGTVTPSLYSIPFEQLTLNSPTTLYVLFGRNDESGGFFTLDSARVDVSGGAVSPDIVFTMANPIGELPNDISLLRLANDRVFYNKIYGL